ncbi:AraC family transcriptional regulator [Agrobacterium leguminum]|uniref:helix-turn-helix domain-containing protein n=1 Tax=Agrobacterium leguminum TaxID=2792015 RepID=UPI002729D592|nr:AraC family transcriptional regulator [Agrobacterium leguminum]WLD96332.1 AraC family transcriptional regulator [Agrobacterium leguminum]
MSRSNLRGKIKKFSLESCDPESLLQSLSVEAPPWAAKFIFRSIGDDFHARMDMTIVGDLWILNISTRTGYVFERYDTGTLRLNVHFIEAGSCLIRTESKDPYVVEAGQTHLFNAKGRSEFQTAPHTVHTILTAPVMKYARLLPVDIGDPNAHFAKLIPIISSGHPVARVLHDTARLLGLPNESHSLFEKLPLSAAMYKDALLQTLILYWPNIDNDSDLSRGPTHSMVRRAINWIEANIGKRVTLHDIANASGAGPRTLQAVFKKEIGVSPIQYLIKTRMRYAHEALADTKNLDSISEICARYGFPHQSDFDQRYRDEYGRTPSETRQLSRINSTK